MTIAAKYLKAGFRFFFRPDQVVNSSGTKVDNPAYGFIDLGVVTALTPGVESNTIELRDTRGGTLQRVAREVTEINESYTGTFADFNRRNLQLMFGAGAVDVNDRSAVDYTTYGENFGNYLQENDMLFLGNSDDVDAMPVFRINETTVSVKTKLLTTSTAADATHVWTEDVHYELDSALGTIKIIEFPTGHTQTHSVAVKYTASAIPATSNTYYTMNPQSAGGIVEGKMKLELGYNGNTERLIRIGKASLNVSSIDFTAEDYSTYQMEFAILNDGTVGSGVGKLFNV